MKMVLPWGVQVARLLMGWHIVEKAGVGQRQQKNINQNATQWKIVLPKNNVDNFACPFGLELESPVKVK